MATIKGCTKVGLNLLLFTVHPMKYGATLMSSFLFNVALILLSTNAAIQFCQQSFALYANETAIYQIWGGQVCFAAASALSIGIGMNADIWTGSVDRCWILAYCLEHQHAGNAASETRGCADAPAAVQIQYLQGIKYLYQLDIFLYCLMGFMILTGVFLFLKGPLKWKRLRPEDAYAT